MNPEHKARLRRAIADLRSRRYEQGYGTLRSITGWCCLGVLTDRYRKDTGRGRWKKLLGGYDGKRLLGWSWTSRRAAQDSDVGAAVLPAEVQEWYGFTTEDPSLGVAAAPSERGFERSASSWNDDCNKTFAQIADAFEIKYLPEDRVAPDG